MSPRSQRARCRSLFHAVVAGWLGLWLFALGGCGPSGSAVAPPSVEWNQQKYGPEPARRPLSMVDVTTDKGWVVAREKAVAYLPSNPPVTSTARFHVGGMDCGDCQHLIASELGKLAGVREARVCQSPPETVVEYDPSRLDAKQIEGTVANLGLWPKPVP